MRTRKTHTRLLVAMLPFLLGGCMSMTSKQPPPDTYVLRPARAVPDTGSIAGNGEKAIIIPEPQVPQGFKTDQIALYMQDGRRLDYYSGAKWAGDLDRVLQDFAVESLDRAWPHVMAATPDAGAPGAWKLVVKVTDLEPVYKGNPDSPPEIDAAFTFTLMTLPDGKILDDFTVRRKAKAPANSLTAITVCMESVLRRVFAEGAHRIGSSLQSGFPH